MYGKRSNVSENISTHTCSPFILDSRSTKMDNKLVYTLKINWNLVWFVISFSQNNNDDAWDNRFNFQKGT